MDFEKLKKNLTRRGYAVVEFSTKDEATAYLNEQIDGKEVAFGGSVTLKEMALYEWLSAHNHVIWHNQLGEGENRETVRRQAMQTPVYLCSVNAIAESGEIVNIDGTGNRLASMLYGHAQLYYVIGENKITPDLESAVARARNIAAPLNAARTDAKTPCRMAQGKCFDCRSPERICRSMVIEWMPMMGSSCEVVLIHEALGF